jgi:GT2 family glycosyltransferase
MSDKLAVAILTIGDLDLVRKCVDSISREIGGVPIFVLNNGGLSSVSKADFSGHDDVQLLTTETNLGCPGGRNFLADRIECEWILFLDDDALLRPGFRAAWQLLSCDNELRNSAAVWAGSVVDVRHSQIRQATGSRRWSFSGGCALINRSVFLDFDGYPTATLRQGEERDLAIRLVGAGYDVRHLNGLVLDHSPSTERYEGDTIVTMNATAAARTSAGVLPIPVALVVGAYQAARVLVSHGPRIAGRFVYAFAVALASRGQRSTTIDVRGLRRILMYRIQLKVERQLHRTPDGR